MPQKIKILKLQKPAEYVQNELDILRGLRNKLLVSTDWTQLIDSGLSLKCVLLWRVWRHKLRAIELKDTKRLHDLTATISQMDLNRPKIIKREPGRFAFILNDFDFSSVDNFKDSCVAILTECYGSRKRADAVKIMTANSIDKALAYLLDAM